MLAFIRLKTFKSGDNTIIEELLLSEILDTRSKQIDVTKKRNGDYFGKHGLKWVSLDGFCTDGAPYI